MANTPIPAAKLQFFDSNGNPLVGGKLFTYDPSTTTTRLTYKDFAGTIQNTNPIILDARGETPGAVYGDGTYRLILKDSLDNTIWDTESKTYATTITSGDIIAALGYTPVNPAANTTFTGANTFSSNNTFSGANTVSGVMTFNAAPAFNIPLNVTSATLAIVNVTNTDAGAAAAVSELFRDSASPASSDVLFTQRVSGRSASGNKRTFSEIETVALDVTNTSEDAQINLKTIAAGTLATRFSLANGFFATGLNDPGAGIINVASLQRNNVTLPRQVRAVSGALTPAISTAPAFTHGLTGTVNDFGAYLVCVTPNNGYVAGDQIILPVTGDSGSNRAVSVFRTATQVVCAFSGSAISLVPATGGVPAVLTLSQWELRLWAESTG